MHISKVVKEYEDQIDKKLNEIHMAASMIEFNLMRLDKGETNENKHQIIEAVLYDCRYIKDELTKYRNYTLSSLRQND